MLGEGIFYFMFKNNKKLYIYFSAVLLFVIFFLIPSFLERKKIANSSVLPASTKQNTESATIIIGDTTTHLSFSPNTSFYNSLAQAKNIGILNLNGKNYPGLGFFVTDIGSLHSGNGKNLLYYINGKKASVGVSSYALKNGDIIEWKLE